MYVARVVACVCVCVKRVRVCMNLRVCDAFRHFLCLASLNFFPFSFCFGESVLIQIFVT